MEYELINIRTVMNKDEGGSGLSFVEAKHDIPFEIKRMYFIYKNEECMQMGFHPHKQSWHLFFCPNGRIDITIDNGETCSTISLDDPSKGLILHPGVWREIKWINNNSVLCVAASGHYEAFKYRKDYESYLKYVAEKKKTTNDEMADIWGESIYE
ncbi:MAG: FdtA/QdtA family cupin domain-containing protein [Eubacteriales bacterium]|nr:FdtA/QdtA family cupin domain-containing protein [Eubacteriales bacterium]